MENSRMQERVQEQTFEYTYSARQQEEIEAIRKKYLPEHEDKMEQLRRLDRSVEKTGTVWGLVLGMIGTLVFGAGMSLCLVWMDTLLLPGILLGVIGAVLIAAAYPLYRRITEKQKKAIAPQILALTEELSK